MGIVLPMGIGCLVAQPTGVHRVSVDNYVSQLVEYLKKVHKYVDEQHS